MFPPQTPAPTTPLTQATSDMAVIEGKTSEPGALLNESEDARTLLSIIQDYDRQEEFVRRTLLRKCCKLMHYWNGFQYLAWDEVAHDWRTAEQVLEDDPQADIDPALYAKVINIYKAHGEILIGALSAGLPTVRFPPKDADDQEDVSTSKAYTKIAELIQKHNRAKLLLMKALFILYNTGMLACYNENKADYRFGSIKTERYEDVSITDRTHFCPSCGTTLGAHQFPTPTPPPINPALPSNPPQSSLNLPPASPGPTLPPQTCPGCNQQVEPDFDDQQSTQSQFAGYDVQPKNRECLELYGPLNVKIPLWVKDQFSTPYLILETEEHVGLLREIYPELWEKIIPTPYPDSYEKEARIPTSYRNDFPRDIATVQRCWLRPWALNNFSDKDKALAIKAKYPDGVYVVIINKNIVAEIVPDKLDEHWTIAENPLAETLHPEPIGNTVVPLQDIENEATNLTLETVEFGIPETFADPNVVDFDEYARQEARPGQISPATAMGGRSLGEGFFTLKAATLSREVQPFLERNTEMAQFVMGSYPSVYGGAQEGGSGTAREYELSRTSALQRLSSTWTIVQEWWAKVLGKSAKSFAENMKEDERFTQSKGSTFLNVWIRKAEIGGEIGDVEAEISEAFPISWSQKRDVMLNLIQMKDPNVEAVITHPENAGQVAALIGVPDLYIPGDDDRNKQLMEIAILIQSEPQMGGMGPMGPVLTSSVPITPDLDNNQIESAICAGWLKSEVGQDAKVNNPGGYANVLAHKREHDAIIAQQQAAQAQAQAQMDNKGLSEQPEAANA